MPQNALKDYQEDRFERGVYDRRNVLNDLTGKEWLFSTKTIIPKKYPSRFPPPVINHDFPPLPIGLSQELIETFTKPTGTVLDPFAGQGSTLLGGYYANLNSTSSNRVIFGFDNDELYLEEFKKVIKYLKIKNLENITFKPQTELNHVANNSVNFILSDLSKVSMIDKQQKESRFDAAINDWVHETSNILKNCFLKLVDKGYIALAVPFCRHGSNNSSKNTQEWNFALTKLLANQLYSLGVVLKAERFWFKPSNSKEEITLISPQRRFLVFRKELDHEPESSSPSLSNLTYLPFGPTSILHKSFPPSFEHKLRGQHGGMKPPELIEYLIHRYSQNQSDIILDPFVGVGGSLLGATLAHRNAIGIDINPHWLSSYAGT
jgi:DNA modification methylase